MSRNWGDDCGDADVGCSCPIAFRKKKIVRVFADRDGTLRLIPVQNGHAFVFSGKGIHRNIGLSRSLPDGVPQQEQRCRFVDLDGAGFRDVDAGIVRELKWAQTVVGSRLSVVGE